MLPVDYVPAKAQESENTESGVGVSELRLLRSRADRCCPCPHLWVAGE